MTQQPTRASKCPPPAPYLTAGFGSALGQRWHQGQPRCPNQSWHGGVFGTWWEFLQAGAGPGAPGGKLYADLLAIFFPAKICLG